MKNAIEPNEFVICPTVGCNLRCTYCFESDAQHKCFSLMSDAQLNTIFNYIKGYVAKYNEQKNSEKSVNKKLPNILLYGGEPLLKNNFHIVKKVLDFARQTKISVGIITNAIRVIPFSLFFIFIFFTFCMIIFIIFLSFDFLFYIFINIYTCFTSTSFYF